MRSAIAQILHTPRSQVEAITPRGVPLRGDFITRLAVAPEAAIALGAWPVTCSLATANTTAISAAVIEQFRNDIRPIQTQRFAGAEAAKAGQRFSMLWIPVLLAALVSIGFTTVSIVFRLHRPFPLNPYESAYVLDGYRAEKGLPVYEPLSIGHATMPYGPLQPYLLGLIYHFTGPNLYGGRVISLLAGLGLTALFIWAFAEIRTFWYGLIVAAMVVSIHYRCRAYFTEARPDLLGLLLASAALMLAFIAHQRLKFWLYVPATFCFLAAFLFKQTFAVTALIPPLAILINRPSAIRRHLVISLSPGIALFACMVILKTCFPLVWFYAFQVQAQMAIPPGRILEGIYDLFIYSPLYVALAFALGMHPGFNARDEPKMNWLLAATVILGLASTLAFAKRGGSYNSLMLGFAPMIAFCIIALPRVIGLLADPNFPRITRGATSAVLGLLFLATTFGIPRSNDFVFHAVWSNGNYREMIKIAKSLPGHVISPDDPTITFFATGQLDRSIDLEATAYGLPSTSPLPINRYFQRATWIIRMDANSGPKNDQWMRDLGFRRTLADGPPQGYSIWRNTRTRSRATPKKATP
jgi:hypothetical protein